MTQAKKNATPKETQPVMDADSNLPNPTPSTPVVETSAPVTAALANADTQTQKNNQAQKSTTQTTNNQHDLEKSDQEKSDQEKAKQKAQANREANQTAVLLLCETYPHLFNLNTPQPLKLGIQQELFDDASTKLSHSKIRRGLATYVRRAGYLQSQTEGAERVDIKGTVAGCVTAEEADYASTRLAKYRAKIIDKGKRIQAKAKSDKSAQESLAQTEPVQAKPNSLAKHKSRSYNKSTPDQRKLSQPSGSGKPKAHHTKNAKHSHQSKAKQGATKLDTKLTAMNPKERMAVKLDMLMNKHK